MLFLLVLMVGRKVKSHIKMTQSLSILLSERNEAKSKQQFASLFVLKLLNSVRPRDIWSTDLNDLSPCIPISWQREEVEPPSRGMCAC